MMIKCCHGCTERILGCHSICPKYISERAEKDQENAVTAEYRMKEEATYLSRERGKNSRRH